MTPPRVQPIVPIPWKVPFDDPDWLFEFKYDGFRALCYLEHRRCRFISRRGNILERFSAMCKQVSAELVIDEAILDGEVITTDETGRPQFYDLLRRAQKPSYVAFDLLWLNGADLRSLPLGERRRRLQDILPKRTPVITEVLSVQGRGRELLELMRCHDLQGIVAKRLGAPRALQNADFVIAHLIHRSEPDRRVVVPYHSGRDLPRGTLGAIIEQAGLSINEFIELL